SSEGSELEIPPSPEVAHFHTIALAEESTLYIPKVSNYLCVDMLLAQRDLFQITVSQNHPIKGQPLLRPLDSLIDSHWILSEDVAQPDDEPRLIFVFPGDIYDHFEKQSYLTTDGKIYHEIPEGLQREKQRVLKIDLNSAAVGKSPGLHQDTDMVE
ncbi:hypothetical protein BGW42_008530, partial [Actinomortierella wolfii]